MGCQSTKCKACNRSFPACQLLNGLCSACRGFKSTIWNIFK